MFDDLIDQIEKFLADGGEPTDVDALLVDLDHVPEEDRPAWYNGLSECDRVALQRAFDGFVAAAQAAAEAWDEFVRAIVEICTAVVQSMIKAIAPFLRDLERLWERERRMALAAWLRRGHVPGWLAAWIAGWWPLRWMPSTGLAPPLLTR